MPDPVQVEGNKFFLHDCWAVDHRSPTAPWNSHPWDTCELPQCGERSGRCSCSEQGGWLSDPHDRPCREE
jgi:hypothetical protein